MNCWIHGVEAGGGVPSGVSVTAGFGSSPSVEVGGQTCLSAGMARETAEHREMRPVRYGRSTDEKLPVSSTSRGMCEHTFV